MAASEGALMRVLGTIERRGFRLRGCAVAADGDAFSVQIEVDGARDGGLLCRQLTRLVDVWDAQVLDDRS